MYYPIDTRTKVDTIVYRTNMLLKAAILCDRLEKIGIPAVVVHNDIEKIPGTNTVLSSDEYSIAVPAGCLQEATQLMQTI